MSDEASRRRRKIEKQGKAVIRELKSHVSRGDALCVIKAPPGSGKTYTLLEAIGEAVKKRLRVAVAAQTNAQCDDICRRLGERYPDLDVWRFLARGASVPADLPDTTTCVEGADELPRSECVVVATTAKWSLIRDLELFDFLFVDEAWQMAWADFMLLSQVAPRFVLIGDPGQIPPVISIPVERWETSPRAPHQPAPEVILADPSLNKLSLELGACWRLPADGVDLIRPFYDFEFDAWAIPGERYLRPHKTPKSLSAVDRALLGLEEATSMILALPTDKAGPPLEEDAEIADCAVSTAVRALELKLSAADGTGDKAIRLRPHDIGISATHRVMNSQILRGLPAALRDHASGVRVDTPERWQGLERKLMIIVHPLSGVVHPSAFDLETGRLCVMASRHRSALVVVSRDHVAETLNSHIPSAEQAVGRADVTGRGHMQHTSFWGAHLDEGRIVRIA